MTPVQVRDEAIKAITYLVAAGLADDQNYPYLSPNGEVTFKNANQLSLALKNKPYATIYEQLRSARVYTALLADGAIIQLSYEYDSGLLLRHRLAFFPCPDLSDVHENPDLYSDDLVYAEKLNRSVTVVPMRFDFDATAGVAVPVDHPMSHLTLGMFENCRIPVSCPVAPLQFLSFVLRNFYRTAVTHTTAHLPIGASFTNACLHETEAAMIHVAVPISN